MDWKQIRSEYNNWLAHSDGNMLNQLRSMDDQTIEDSFYRDLSFGTGGLRGKLGAGTNRMNEYVVARASQGLANYLLEACKTPSVVIGHDSRRQSEEFAKTAAEVFAANGVHVYFWQELLPVPTVSYAVRELNADAGVMITASHNPAEYNGYKVYGPDGCQITSAAAKAILNRIRSLQIFDDVRREAFASAYGDGRIEFISQTVLDRYYSEVQRQSVLFGDEADHDISIVYTPLNGTGLIPVTTVLNQNGFSKVYVVAEQRLPDGDFTTCPYPNPEIREAMELGLRDCRRLGADLLLATDPDCDRCGIAVRMSDGDYNLLNGNEIGILLLDYICMQRLLHRRMPEHPVFVKTIVTTELAQRIADHYGVETLNVLTGFKYIGELIGALESENRAADYIFGFEESYGYLSGAYVRDKDGVNAAYLICEMAAYYKARGMNLVDQLERLYAQYGYCKTTLRTDTFDGSAGMERMQTIMADFRRGIDQIAGHRVLYMEDYLKGRQGLPSSDVLKFCMEKASVVIRPSGTEPKLKLYFSVTAQNEAEAMAMEAALWKDLHARMH